MNTNTDIIKVIVIGDPGTGKTSMILRHSQRTFIHDSTTTLAYDLKTKYIEVPNGRNFKLHVYDSHNNSFSLTSNFYRGANGIIICYDVTSKDSFDNIHKWLAEIKRYCTPDTPTMVVGCKADQDKVVTSEQLKRLADGYNLKSYYECSSMTGDNIDEVFASMFERVLPNNNNSYTGLANHHSSPTTKLKNSLPKPKGLFNFLRNNNNNNNNNSNNSNNNSHVNQNGLGSSYGSSGGGSLSSSSGSSPLSSSTGYGNSGVYMSTLSGSGGSNHGAGNFVLNHPTISTDNLASTMNLATLVRDKKQQQIIDKVKENKKDKKSASRLVKSNSTGSTINKSSINRSVTPVNSSPVQQIQPPVTQQQFIERRNAILSRSYPTQVKTKDDNNNNNNSNSNNNSNQNTPSSPQLRNSSMNVPNQLPLSQLYRTSQNNHRELIHNQNSNTNSIPVPEIIVGNDSPQRSTSPSPTPSSPQQSHSELLPIPITTTTTTTTTTTNTNSNNNNITVPTITTTLSKEEEDKEFEKAYQEAYGYHGDPGSSKFYKDVYDLLPTLPKSKPINSMNLSSGSVPNTNLRPFANIFSTSPSVTTQTNGIPSQSLSLPQLPNPSTSAFSSSPSKSLVDQQDTSNAYDINSNDNNNNNQNNNHNNNNNSQNNNQNTDSPPNNVAPPSPDISSSTLSGSSSSSSVSGEESQLSNSMTGGTSTPPLPAASIQKPPTPTSDNMGLMASLITNLNLSIGGTTTIQPASSAGFKPLYLTTPSATGGEIFLAVPRMQTHNNNNHHSHNNNNNNSDHNDGDEGYTVDGSNSNNSSVETSPAKPHIDQAEKGRIDYAPPKALELSSNSLFLGNISEAPMVTTNESDNESINDGYGLDDAYSKSSSPSSPSPLSKTNSNSSLMSNSGDAIVNSNNSNSNNNNNQKSNSINRNNNSGRFLTNTAGYTLNTTSTASSPPSPTFSGSTTSSSSASSMATKVTTSNSSTTTDHTERANKDDLNENLNERFQRVVLQFRDIPSLDTNLFNLQEISTDLLHISQDFIHIVKTYGRIIIEERYLEEKTIQCKKNMGGHLGGEKYVVRNVLFKFAGGVNKNDEWVGAKIGGQELKGCMATLNSPVDGLCVPLMALVDFMGYRLIAMSVLPITPKTIVYGSSDMGRNVHSDKKSRKIMKGLSRALNLKKHMGGTVNPTKVYSATDIEGHNGTDNRFYLIDFSRTFPPTYPDDTITSGHLFQLFRPEFLKTHPKPLCSDAFSGFIKHDPNRAAHNLEVKEATVRILTELIPKMTVRLKWLLKEALENNTLTGGVHIPEQFHRHGVNIRYIGHMLNVMDDRTAAFVLLIEAIARVLKNDLRRRYREKMKDLRNPSSAPYTKITTNFLNLVFGESAVPEYGEPSTFWEERVKSELINKFYIFQVPHVIINGRYVEKDKDQNNNVNIGGMSGSGSSYSVSSSSSMASSGVTSQSSNNPASSLSVSSMSLNTSLSATSTPSIRSTTGGDDGSHNNLSQSANIMRKIPVQEGYWPLREILEDRLISGGGQVVLGRHLLFTRLRDMTHLKFRSKTMEKVADTTRLIWNSYKPFSDADLKKIGVRVKHTDLVTNAEGTFFYAKAMGESSTSTALHLLHKARKKFELALISNPNNKETLQLCSATWCKILEFTYSEGKNMSNVQFSMDQPAVVNTDRYFLRAIDADPKGPVILFFYARFLGRCLRHEKAEDYFLRSLEVDPSNYRCLIAYASFLNERGYPNEASLFLQRAQNCKNILQNSKQQQQQHLPLPSS